MKRLFFTFLSLWMILNVSAQGVNLGVAFPQNDTRFDQSISKILVNRLQAILNKDDISEAGGDFVIIPKTSVLSNDLIESGMKNIYKVEIELTLNVTQLSSNKSFGTISIELKGSGMRNEQAAFKDAISSIKKTNPQLDNFFKTTKQKIIDYYQSNTSAILSQASSIAQQGDYEKAIAMLSSYPVGLKGSTEVTKKLNQIYDAYRTKNCQQIILEARSAISVKNYSLALDLLSGIDTGSSSCKSEATSLINSINKEVRAKDAQDRADRQRRESLAADVEKTRLNAAAQVAKAYYQRTYPTYYIIW